MKNYIRGWVMAAIIIFCAILPSVSLASFDVSLKYGSKGQAVMDLQDFLTDQGDYLGKIDGKFGFGMLRAVKKFQAANNLSADGYFGLASRKAANDIVDALLAPSNATEQSETGSVAAVQPTSPSAPPVTTPPPFDVCKNIEGIQTLAPDGMYVDNGNCLSTSNVPVFIPDTTQLQAQEALQVKQAKIDAKKLQIANLNAKRASDIASARSEPGMTVGQSNNVVNEINRQYFIDYDILEAQVEQIQYSQP